VCTLGTLAIVIDFRRLKKQGVRAIHYLGKEEVGVKSGAQAAL